MDLIQNSAGVTGFSIWIKTPAEGDIKGNIWLDDLSQMGVPAPLHVAKPTTQAQIQPAEPAEILPAKPFLPEKEPHKGLFQNLPCGSTLFIPLLFVLLWFLQRR